MLERRRAALIKVMTIGIVAGLASGCEAPPKPPPEAPPEPSAFFPPESIMTVSLGRIGEYAARLQFDSVLGADSQYVDFARGQIGTEMGTWSRIEPESGSYQLSRRDLAAGRIIARIRTAAEVPSWGFGPWWTWWWVDGRGPGGALRSVFVAGSEKQAYRVTRKDTLEVEDHGGRRFRQALARWQVVRVTLPSGDPTVIASWGTCPGCCKQR
jgi:hypothetical protein